jgi:hypothetical protein
MIASEQNGCYIVYERIIGAWVGYVIGGAEECEKSEGSKPTR